MEMVLIRAPPSGLIVKAVCISVSLREASDAQASRAHMCQRKAPLPLLSFVWEILVAPSLEGVSSYPCFLHPLIYLSEIAAGYWSLFQSCHRVESKFTLSLLRSAVFSVPFGKNNSQRWERSNKRGLTGRNVRGDAIFSVCTLDRNRKRRKISLLKAKNHPTLKHLIFKTHKIKKIKYMVVINTY